MPGIEVSSCEAYPEMMLSVPVKEYGEFAWRIYGAVIDGSFSLEGSPCRREQWKDPVNSRAYCIWAEACSSVI